MESRKTRYGERYFIKSYSKDGEFTFTYSIYEYTMRSGIKDKHVYMVENTAWDGEVMCQFIYETYEQADLFPDFVDVSYLFKVWKELNEDA